MRVHAQHDYMLHVLEYMLHVHVHDMCVGSACPACVTLRPVHVRDAMPVKVMRRDKILAVLSTCVRSKLVTTGTAEPTYVPRTFTDGLAHGVLE